ncbi:hypothetical protein BDV39DRAFT_204686 [Aspergillus sergii]|uniref:Uncharacterized protein n=1 Tax=Aspergillus sergii TaxID=1034303 RepID=A0A5N6X367_9EURO|nr:hypothetical protein BDV39DRAFT_204686 [Aspergillus sergii]
MFFTVCLSIKILIASQKTVAKASLDATPPWVEVSGQSTTQHKATSWCTTNINSIVDDLALDGWMGRAWESTRSTISTISAINLALEGAHGREVGTGLGYNRRSFNKTIIRYFGCIQQTPTCDELEVKDGDCLDVSPGSNHIKYFDDRPGLDGWLGWAWDIINYQLQQLLALDGWQGWARESIR